MVWTASTQIACAKPTGTCPTWSDRVYVCNYLPGTRHAMDVFRELFMASFVLVSLVCLT